MIADSQLVVEQTTEALLLVNDAVVSQKFLLARQLRVLKLKHVAHSVKVEVPRGPRLGLADQLADVDRVVVYRPEAKRRSVLYLLIRRRLLLFLQLLMLILLLLEHGVAESALGCFAIDLLLGDAATRE